MGMLWTRSKESYLLPKEYFQWRLLLDDRYFNSRCVHYWFFCLFLDDVLMYYCSCLHNWQWPRAQNRWLASPQTTHQRFVLKWLPHRKFMAKVWNVITPLPYFQMKRFSDIFSGLRQAIKWTKFKVCISELLNVFEDSAQHKHTIAKNIFLFKNFSIV